MYQVEQNAHINLTNSTNENRHPTKNIQQKEKREKRNLTAGNLKKNMKTYKRVKQTRAERKRRVNIENKRASREEETKSGHRE